MILSAENDDGQPKQLTPDELREVRDCWGMGCPLSMLAKQHDIDEQELRHQLGLQARQTCTTTLPPALIGPDEINQMRSKRQQRDALELWAADREGRTDGR